MLTKANTKDNTKNTTNTISKAATKVTIQTLVDHQGRAWSLDERLCRGGFGTIYSCAESDKVVVKTQPRSDDQLRKEERFYRDLSDLMRNRCAPKYIPDLVTSGVANDLRFIVIERFPFDLQRFIDNIQLSKHERCDMARQLISAIRFIHSFGYSHGDLKAKNVLVRSEGGTVSLYITDFGLVHKFMKDGVHVPYTPGKLCLHRGTLSFISEDSHIGAIPSRRSDLENMGWLLIASLFGGVLPWSKVTGKSPILSAKRDAKRMISRGENSLFKKMMPGQSHKRMLRYMIAVVELTYKDEPDYQALEKIFEV
jgi:vaccinia related kinase